MLLKWQSVFEQIYILSRRCLQFTRCLNLAQTASYWAITNDLVPWSDTSVLAKPPCPKPAYARANDEQTIVPKTLRVRLITASQEIVQKWYTRHSNSKYRSTTQKSQATGSQRRLCHTQGVPSRKVTTQKSLWNASLSFSFCSCSRESSYSHQSLQSHLFPRSFSWTSSFSSSFSFRSAAYKKTKMMILNLVARGTFRLRRHCLARTPGRQCLMKESSKDLKTTHHDQPGITTHTKKQKFLAQLDYLCDMPLSQKN